jgi:hypothetical protein
VIVGDEGDGRFTQWGEVTVNVAGILMLGSQATSRGTYILDRGSLNVTGGTILAGDGEAVFILAGSHLRYAGTFGPDLVNTGGVLRPNWGSAGTV